MRKLLPRLAVAAMTVTLLAGCSTSEDPEPTVKQNTTQWSTEADEKDGKGAEQVDADDKWTETVEELKSAKKETVGDKTYVKSSEGELYEVLVEEDGTESYHYTEPDDKGKKYKITTVTIPEWKGMNGTELQKSLKLLDGTGAIIMYIDMNGPTGAYVDEAELYKYTVCFTSFDEHVGDKYGVEEEQYAQFFMAKTC